MSRWLAWRWVLAFAAACLAAVAWAWPLLASPPLALDDRALLDEFGRQPLASVLGYDHFGHLRPLKNLWFWSVARQGSWLAWFRAAALTAAIGCSVLIWRHALRWLAPPFALATALLWLLNPTTVSVIAWLSAQNHVFALLGVLLYLQLSAHALGEPRSRSRQLQLGLAHVCWLGAVLWHELSLLAPAMLFLQRRADLGTPPKASPRVGCTSPRPAPQSGRAQRSATVSATPREPDESTSRDARDAPRSSAAKSHPLDPVHAQNTPDVLLPSAAGRPLGIGVGCVLAGYGLLRLLQTAPTLEYRRGDQAAWLHVASSARYLAENLRLWVWQAGRFGVLLPDDPRAHAPATLAAWVGVLLAAYGGIQWARRDPVAAFALGWSALFLLPLINLIPLGNRPVAVHYLCLSGAGLALLLARAAEQLTRRRGRPTQLLAAGALGVLILAWQPEARRTRHAWASDVNLYSATLTNYPAHREAQVNLAAAHLARQQYAEAATLLRESLARAPDDVVLLGQQLELLVATGRIAEALAFLDARPALSQMRPELMVRRALWLLQLGQREPARQAFQHVLDVSTIPNDRFTAGYRLALLLVEDRQPQRARSQLQTLRNEFPNDPDVTRTLQLLDRILGAPP